MITSVAPIIDATGIRAPTFADILAYLTAQYQNIYGADVYLGNDSQDGQFIAIIAKALADTNAAAIAVYNAYAPATAQGVGLSAAVKINGLKRQQATSSWALLTIAGVAGTVINNGQATDINNNKWALPASVTIPLSSAIVVIATSVTPGVITAAPLTITKIATPVYGWQSVTNIGAATVGTMTESDAALRIRQAISVALPSVTVFDGIWASIESVLGVTRVMGYQNATNFADANSIPAHNIAFIVEGGLPTPIENAIAAKIPPGIPTFGTTTGVVTDAFGSTRSVSYSVAIPENVGVQLNITKLVGWSLDVQNAITASLIAYLTSLDIGQKVTWTKMFAPAYAALAQFPGAYQITGLTINLNGGAFGTTDLTIPYNGVAYSNSGLITYALV